MLAGANLLVVLAVLGCCFGKPPSVPSSFSANVFFNISMANRQAIQSREVFLPASFSPNAAMYQASLALFGRRDARLSMSTLQTAATSTVVVNGQCRTSSGSFAGVLDFYLGKFLGNNATRPAGDREFDGVPCKTWALNTAGVNYLFASRAEDPQVPVFSRMSSDSAGISLSLTFRNVSTVDPPPEPPTCPKPFYCEPEGAPWQQLSMLRLQTPEDWTLGNRNTADWVGEAYYLCSELLGEPSALRSSLVTLYRMRVNASYSQYNQCSDEGVCAGAVMDTVGREAPDGFGPQGGQCRGDPSVYGTWYSLPIKAQGVSWRVQQRLKSVSVRCLLKQGLLESCRRQFDFPLGPTTRLLRSALTGDLCEDIPPA